MHAIIKLIIADNKTADADMSFTFFMVRLKSGETRSHNFSMAELMISQLSTIAKHRRMIIHSFTDKRKNIPAIMTSKASIY